MKRAIIVQARMGSSRLPGKILEPLGSQPALSRVLARCKKIDPAAVVVCAVPEEARDDPVAALAEQSDVIVVRGSETDVLSRYAKAAREVDADEIMRVTSDCPFLDPQVCRQVLELRLKTGTAYACNTMPAGFPHGLDCEAFSAEQLHAADRFAETDYEREHVTVWMRRRADPSATASLVGPGGDAAQLRWTLDYAEDLAFCQAVFDRLGEQAASIDWESLAGIVLAAPTLRDINASRVDPERSGSAETAGHTVAYPLDS